MRKLKNYTIHFTTIDSLTGRRRNVCLSGLGYSLKSVLSHLRSVGYTISRDYFYYVD